MEPGPIASLLEKRLVKSTLQIALRCGLTLFVTINKTNPIPSARPIVAINDEILERRVIAYLAKVPGAIKGNHGHDTLFSVAEALVNGFCLDPNAAAAIAWEHYNSKCDPAWKEVERADFDRKFSEAENKPTGKGRGYLLDAERKTEHVELPALIDSTPPKENKPKNDSVKKSKADSTPTEEKKPGPCVVSFDEIEETEVEWLLQDVIPLGMVTTLVGDPGQGKSFLTCWMASCVTCDDTILFRNKPVPKGTVLVCNSEDDAGKTIKLRLRQNGANMKKVKTIPYVLMAGRDSDKKEVLYEMPITLDNLADFEAALDQIPDCQLLIVDPVTAFWGDTNDQKNAEVRVVLAQLKKLAEKRNIAIVLVSHLNKSVGADAISRITGSGGLPAASRTTWLVSEKDDLRTVSCVKSNISENRKGFTFRIISGEIQIDSYESDEDANEILQAEYEASQGKRGRNPEQSDEAVEWLEGFLKDGRKLVGNKISPEEGTIRYESEQAGHSWRTVERAKKKLYATAKKEDGKWGWSLPIWISNTFPNQDRQNDFSYTPVNSGILELDAETLKNKGFCEEEKLRMSRMPKFQGIREVGILAPKTPISAAQSSLLDCLSENPSEEVIITT